MQELFKKFILLTKILLAVFLAGTVLSLFCVWYLDTGVHIYNKSGATDYKWESNQMKSTMIEGFAWLKNDIIFVDTISAFESLYKEKHILAHGFTNTAVGSGHLNEYGHKLVAEVVAKMIKEHSNVSQ